MDKPNFAFWDECSTTRHFFAKLRLCKHKGKWLNAKQYFQKIYDSLPLYGKTLNIVKKDDQTKSQFLHKSQDEPDG